MCVHVCVCVFACAHVHECPLHSTIYRVLLHLSLVGKLNCIHLFIQWKSVHSTPEAYCSYRRCQTQRWVSRGPAFGHQGERFGSRWWGLHLWGIWARLSSKVAQRWRHFQLGLVGFMHVITTCWTPAILKQYAQIQVVIKTDQVHALRKQEINMWAKKQDAFKWWVL